MASCDGHVVGHNNMDEARVQRAHSSWSRLIDEWAGKLHFSSPPNLSQCSSRAFSAVALSADKSIDLQFLQRGVCRMARVVNVERKRGEIRLSQAASSSPETMRPDCGTPPFSRQPGIGHDFVEQLRRNAAALRDLAMKYWIIWRGELVPSSR